MLCSAAALLSALNALEASMSGTASVYHLLFMDNLKLSGKSEDQTGVNCTVAK